MSNLLTIKTDTAALFAALEGLGLSAEKHLLSAADETGGHVAAEARSRVSRATGATARGITVGRAKVGIGVVVFVNRPDNPGLPGWLEGGTKFMTARPFLFDSARMEKGPHDRRVAQALQDAIDEGGFK